MVIQISYRRIGTTEHGWITFQRPPAQQREEEPTDTQDKTHSVTSHRLAVWPTRQDTKLDMDAIHNRLQVFRPYRGQGGEWTLEMFSASAASWFASPLASAENEMGKKYGRANAIESLLGTTIRCSPKAERERVGSR